MTPVSELVQAVAQRSAEQMAFSLAAGSALAACAWAALRLARRADSSTRFALWFSVMISMAAVPLLAIGGGPAVHRASSLVTLPAGAAPVMFAIWAVVALALLARVAAGVVQLHRLRRSCTPVAPEQLALPVRQLLEDFQLTRRVALCTSDRIQVPAAIGLFKPIVVIPSWLLNELSAGELEQVLLHELAHLRRRDDWSNLAQQAVKALLFFHPLVWWIDARVSLEREMACDDAVLAQTASPRAYAECLARLAEKSLGRRGAALAQAAVHRMRQTTLRVAQILGGRRPATHRAWKIATAGAASLAFFVTVAVGRTTELVSFSTGPEPVVARVSGIQPALVPAAINDRTVAALGALVHPAKLSAVPGKAARLANVSPAAAMSSAGLVHAARFVDHAADRRESNSAVRHHAAVARVATVRDPGTATNAALTGALASETQVAHAVVVTFVTGQVFTGTPQGWVVQVWQLTVYVPAAPQGKQGIPQKSI